MTKITNKTPHPYDIHTKDGVKVIAAFGTLEADFDPAYLDRIKLSFEVEEVTEDRDDEQGTDGSGTSGDYRAGEVRGKAEGQSPEAEYEALTGKKPDGRWSEERVLAEIAKLKS